MTPNTLVHDLYAHAISSLSVLLFAERQAKLAEVESKWEEKKEVLDQELAKLEMMLASTFDRYAVNYWEGRRGKTQKEERGRGKEGRGGEGKGEGEKKVGNKKKKGRGEKKKRAGESGHRSRYLSHAKRALYHVS